MGRAEYYHQTRQRSKSESVVKTWGRCTWPLAASGTIRLTRRPAAAGCVTAARGQPDSAAGRPASSGRCRRANGPLLPGQLLPHNRRRVLGQLKRLNSQPPPHMAPPLGGRRGMLPLLLPQRLHGGRRQQAGKVQLPACGELDRGAAMAQKWNNLKGADPAGRWYLLPWEISFSRFRRRCRRGRCLPPARRGPALHACTPNALTARARAPAPGGGALQGARSGGRACGWPGSRRRAPSAIAMRRGGRGASAGAPRARVARAPWLGTVRAPAHRRCAAAGYCTTICVLLGAVGPRSGRRR